MTSPLEERVLPSGIRSGFADGINGLRMHVLEAGGGPRRRPPVVLLHDFPELAYSWRKVMLPLAAAGFPVVAPEQRDYGRTTGWDADYDGDLHSFGVLNPFRDTLGLASALGCREVAGVFGPDFGASVAAWGSLVRPDVFRSVALMSAPFADLPDPPFDTAEDPPRHRPPGTGIHEEFAKLGRPRKHNQWYYSTRQAHRDMHDCPQRVHAFLRAYFNCNSADGAGNKPFPLKSWTAGGLAKMTTYYIVDLPKNMAETVVSEIPTAAETAACRWLPDTELCVYNEEYERTGFLGFLQWSRWRTEGRYNAELQLFSGRTIDGPSILIAGKCDWGAYQRPGNFERMQLRACSRMPGCHLVDGAEHWVQQEQPEPVSRLLIEFLQRQ